MLNRILAIVLLAWLALMAGAAVVYRDAAERVGRRVETFLDQALTLAIYCMVGVMVFAAVAAVWVGVAWWVRRRVEDRRERDGSVPIQVLKINGRTLIVDPNKMIAPVLAVDGDGAREFFTASPEAHLQHALARARVAGLQALAPGDNAIANVHGAHYRPAGLAASANRVLNEDRKPSPALPSPSPALPSPAAPRLLFSDAVSRARADQLIIGQQPEAGALAIFNPALHGHGAVIGSTGTGKTTGAAFTAVAGAIRAGYHVVLLDPDGGRDWSIFRSHSEWMECDAGTLPDQVDALAREYMRRGTEEGGRPVLVVIEEFGDLMRQLRLTDRRAADAVEGNLDTILRRGRRRGLHVLLVDQYPEHWSQQVIAGVKWRAVHRLGPNQGAKLEEYNVARLPERGAFRCDGELYEAWHAAPEVRALLASMPAPMLDPIVDTSWRVVRSPHGAGGGGVTRGEQSDERLGEQSDERLDEQPRDAEGWYQWMLSEYLPSHPELLRVDAEGRGVGVSALARAMAVRARGDSGQYAAYKGLASEIAKRLRAELRLPTADRIGADVSRPVNGWKI